MLDETTRQDLLKKILNSNEFCNSTVYGNYLTYLVNSTMEGKLLKETTIAFDVFGKDADFNPAEDTIVRSHTYTLRKKLERYYFTEGKEDKYRIRIPKGHYEVTFTKVSPSIFSLENSLKWLREHYYLGVILILLIALFLLWSQNRATKNQLANYQIIELNDFIWKEYLQSELPILIVPGDHFFFDIYSEEYGRTIGVREPTINSVEDLDSFRAQFPNASIQRSAEPYFPYHSIWSLPPILSILYSANQKPIMRKSSTISAQMLDEYNIIFVGSIKTLYALRHTIVRSHFNFGISPHYVDYTVPDSGNIKHFTTDLHSSGPNDDLVLVLKLPGPAGNCIFIIASYHSLGAPEIARYLTNPDSRYKLKNLFLEKYNHIPTHFEILFRVVGIDKTAYSTEILICNPLSSN